MDIRDRYYVTHGVGSIQPLKAQYANGGSGVNATDIGWINFEENFSILNNSQPVHVVNTLKNGVIVSFDISITVNAPANIANQVGFVSSVVPTYGDAPFGNTAYTGLGGYSALMLNRNWPIGDIVVATLNLTNIQVRSCCGQAITDFVLYAADAETTNQGFNSEAEFWEVQRPVGTGIWTLVQQMRNVSNTLTGPTISGIGTNIFTEIGTRTSNWETSAYVVSTPAPTSITAIIRTDGGREGIAFGFSVPAAASQISYQCGQLRSNPVSTINPIFACTITKYDYCIAGDVLAIMYGETLYPMTSNGIKIIGNAANYRWYPEYVIASDMVNDAIEREDLFLVVFQSYGKIYYKTVLFKKTM